MTFVAQKIVLSDMGKWQVTQVVAKSCEPEDLFPVVPVFFLFNDLIPNLQVASKTTC